MQPHAIRVEAIKVLYDEQEGEIGDDRKRSSTASDRLDSTAADANVCPGYRMLCRSTTRQSPPRSRSLPPRGDRDHKACVSNLSGEHIGCGGAGATVSSLFSARGYGNPMVRLFTAPDAAWPPSFGYASRADPDDTFTIDPPAPPCFVDIV